MSDKVDSSSPSPVSVDENPPAPSTPNKKSKSSKKTAIKKPAAKSNHPPTSEMVINAITTLKERNGSSLQAIKKYIATNYQIDTDRLAPFIKKFLKNAVSSGKLVQTKGKGASGSFKLPSPTKPSGEKKKKPSKPKASAKKVKAVKKEKKIKEKSKTLTEIATINALPEKKNHAISKKESKKSNAPTKSATIKQKSTKPSKVASKVKALKTKKAPSAKKATSGGSEKKASKATKTN